MVLVNLQNGVCSDTVHNKLGTPNGYGENIYGVSFYGEKNDRAGIFKTRRNPIKAPTHYGFKLYGYSRYGESLESNARSIEGRRSTGQIQIKTKFYVPTYRNTEAQQTMRGKFADAITTWQALDTEQKEEYNTRAKSKNLTGYNFFIKEYLISH